jgi:hypothetical protein
MLVELADTLHQQIVLVELVGTLHQQIVLF